MKTKLIVSLLAGASLFASTALSLVHANSFPEKSINFVVPYPPGGGTDITTRLLTDKISKTSDWNFVVENRPGAAGSIGLGYLTRQTPDGYTLAMGQTSNMTINPNLNKDISYNSLEDFSLISVIATQPVVVVVANQSPYTNLNDLLNDAKSGKTLTLGTPGIGTVSHLAMEYLGQMSNTKIRHIPYPGATQAITEAMGGHLSFVATSLPSALSQIRAGSVRPLAVTSAERTSALPDVPSISELGYDGYDVNEWKAVIGPAHIDPATVTSLNAAIRTALNDPELIDAFEREGSTILGSSPEEFQAMLNEEYPRWGQVLRDANITK
ncbi:Bug family tripartite tricarboxylate transporter substrate binding protein [Paenalcaligenes hominis]|uniref:Bug family tripartite tricarboxylate transporter substrate binding protein n=1 Tax=Paenalcaligenes hominis TaxID=643674 RepID=UPI0035265A0B